MHVPTPSRWRAFAGGRYRPFHAIAVGQSFAGSFASDPLFVPLLLHLGAPAWFVILVGSTPIAGTMLQAWLPQMLRRMHGDLRQLTVLLAIAEMRGFVHAAVVAAAAAGLIGDGPAIVLVALTVAIGQTLGMLSASNISLWTAVVLDEEERRLVAPRQGAVNMALNTCLLLPAGFALDAATHQVGLWAYAAFFAAGGTVPIVTQLALRRLPLPGRVLVSETHGTARSEPAGFGRFVRATTIAAFGQGVLPYLAMYAMQVLGQSAGFAVVLSGVASAGSLIGSLAAGTFLLRGSASRTLRLSFGVRALAAVMCASALPANPAAPVLLLGGALLFNAAGNAGALAQNERLYRLVPPDARVRCQGRFVASTSAAAAGGAVVCAAALAIAATPVWLPYVALYGLSGLSRSAAAIVTEVTPSWRSPAAAPARIPEVVDDRRQLRPGTPG